MLLNVALSNAHNLASSLALIVAALG